MDFENIEGYGEKYLEKIVNAEIRLPKADEILLAGYWDKLLNDLVIDVDLSDEDDFIKFNKANRYIFVLIENIRMAKKYINAIKLKKPFLKRGLNFVDFFIIESISS